VVNGAFIQFFNLELNMLMTSGDGLCIQLF